MKANELMIGDWIHNKFTNENYRVWPTFYSQCTDYGRTPEKDIDELFEPIPITPEILEKNGFLEKNVFAETLGVDELWGLEEYSCGVCGGENDTWEFEVYEPWIERDYDGSPDDWGFFAKTHIKDIRYVHELQHALLLCGMDKKIEL